MKNTNAFIINQINRFEKDQGGLFTTADLYSIIASKNPITNQRIILNLVREKVLTKIKRGFYITPRFNPLLTASRLLPKSYISMETVLVQNGLVATINPRLISCVTIKPRPTRLQTPEVKFVYHTIDKKLYFGFTLIDGGINIADNEKAYLDLLYFYMKGKKYSFDPKNEVCIEKLNKAKLNKYLRKYKNSKFKKFVKGLLDE